MLWDAVWSYPLRGRLDVRLWRRAWIRTSGAFEAADGPDGHVVIARNLAREADAGEAFGGQALLLGQRHAGGLAVDELDAAGGAAGIAPAGVQDVYLSVLLDRQHQPLIFRNVYRCISLDCECGHPGIVWEFRLPAPDDPSVIESLGHWSIWC
jgi:hypothetical protein